VPVYKQASILKMIQEDFDVKPWGGEDESTVKKRQRDDSNMSPHISPNLLEYKKKKGPISSPTKKAKSIAQCRSVFKVPLFISNISLLISNRKLFFESF
jgi:hypothetical protein